MSTWQRIRGFTAGSDGARFLGTECQRHGVMWRTAACCHAVRFGTFMWDPFLLIL